MPKSRVRKKKGKKVKYRPKNKKQITEAQIHNFLNLMQAQSNIEMKSKENEILEIFSEGKYEIDDSVDIEENHDENELIDNVNNEKEEEDYYGKIEQFDDPLIEEIENSSLENPTEDENEDVEKNEN